VAVPAIVSEETFARVQAKLDTNQQTAARATPATSTCCGRWSAAGGVGCGAPCAGPRPATATTCAGGAPTRSGGPGPAPQRPLCPGRAAGRAGLGDLCTLLADPTQVACALERAWGGAWLPQELQARQATLRQALGQLERQQQRLLDASLAEVVGLAELERKRQALDRRRATLLTQQRQLDAVAHQRLELGAVAGGIEAFCQTVRAGLATATFPSGGCWSSCSSTAWS
jgi:site-specific DNA recombinase